MFSPGGCVYHPIGSFALRVHWHLGRDPLLHFPLAQPVPLNYAPDSLILIGDHHQHPVDAIAPAIADLEQQWGDHAHHARLPLLNRFTDHALNRRHDRWVGDGIETGRGLRAGERSLRQPPAVQPAACVDELCPELGGDRPYQG